MASLAEGLAITTLHLGFRRIGRRRLERSSENTPFSVVRPMRARVLRLVANVDDVLAEILLIDARLGRRAAAIALAAVQVVKLLQLPGDVLLLALRELLP